MKIVYTKHAQKKFADLKKFSVFVSISQIQCTVMKPKYHSSDNGNSIVASDFDQKHNLRVVYFRQKDDIIIITFYIYRKGRYGET